MLFILFISLAFANSDTSCDNAYCSECDSNKKCTECIDGYILVNGDCKYMRDEHCNKVSSLDSSICIECLDGYKIDPTQKKCVQGQEICTSYNYLGTYTCTEYKCSENQFSTPKGCIDCSSNKYCYELEDDATDCSKCKQCMRGTILVNGKCQPIDENCENFEFATGDNNNIVFECYKCISGYYLGGDGKCKKGNIENCVSYLPDGSCEVCRQHGVVDDDECTDECDVENCNVCYAGSSGVCVFCNEGYALTKYHQCVPNPANCNYARSSSETGKIYCTDCKEGYYDDEYGVCQPYPEHCIGLNYGKDKCSSCEEGYYLTNEYKCSKCSGDCKECSGSADYCDSCKDESKVAYDGKCYTRIEGCNDYNENGKCESCNWYYGYTLGDDGKCKFDECETKEGENCTSCVYGYYMTKDYKCQKCDDKCYNGCIHTASSCKSSDFACFQYKADGQCASCLYDYELDDGECVYEENEENEQYGCFSETYFDEKCLLCYDKKTYEFADVDANGECIPNGTTSMVIAFLLVVLMLLF